MSAVGTLDSFQRRHPVLGLPIALIYKFVDDQGPYLAALITYYGFISIFPLLLLLSSILGFVLQNNPDLQTSIIDSALAQLPVIGEQVHRAELRGSSTAVVIGTLGALYGAIGVAQAMQNALNISWYVPRNSRPNPFLARAKSLAMLVAVALFLVTSTLLSQLSPTLEALGISSRAIGMWPMFASAVLTFLLFQLVSRFGTSYPVSRAQALPGSLLGVLCWQTLQSVGAEFVRAVVAGQSATNGVFAVVLGLLGWIYLASVAFVLCSELNVVLALRLYPRALLTPLTDHVDLTEADLAAYAGMARAQRLKGFQAVEVTFEHDGQYASARRNAKAADEAAAEAHQATARRAEQAAKDRAWRKETERVLARVAQPAGGLRARVASAGRAVRRSVRLRRPRRGRPPRVDP